MNTEAYPVGPAVENLPCLHGAALATTLIRCVPEDFIVDECLGFEADNEGEHAFLHVRKRSTNTEWVARQLARIAGVPAREVSYAGQKDRHAETTQWFSVRLAGKQMPDWQSLVSDQIELITVTRHGRKLRRGALQGNRFTLTLRDIDGDIQALIERLKNIQSGGVPNYFGEQRFGRNNLGDAAMMLSGRKRVKRHQRSMYLSAARSMLFNTVLAQRLNAGDGLFPLSGDTLMLEGSNSIFSIEDIDDEIIQRFNEGDVHPTGPLWGRGELKTSAAAYQLESAVLNDYSQWCEGLEKAGLSQQRRSLRVIPTDMEWELLDDEKDSDDMPAQAMRLSFGLPAGSYATAVLRECFNCRSGVIREPAK